VPDAANEPIGPSARPPSASRPLGLPWWLPVVILAVLILGSDGVAAAAAPAGVLMTVTGTVGGLCFAAWAGADQLWSVIRRARLRRAHARDPRSH
jgi:hypothetical protein